MSPKQQSNHETIGRGQTGKALEKSNGNFQALFGNLLEGAQILGYDWRYLYLNASAERHNRRPNQELLGRIYMDMWMGIEDTPVFSLIERCMEKRVASELENRFIYPDGAVGWFALSIQPIPEGVLILSFDISERVNAEIKVVQMKRLYATLSQVNQTIVRIKQADELYQSICDVAVKFGEFALAWVGLLDETSGNVKPVAANGLDVTAWPFQIVNINEGPLKDGLVATAIRTDKVITSEDLQTDERFQSLRTKLEQHGYHSSAVVPFHLRDRTIGILSLVSCEAGFFKSEDEIRLLDEMGLDISFALDMMQIEGERKQAEEELRKSEEKYRFLFENNPHPMWVYDLATLAFLAVNDAAVEKYGYTREEFLKMTIADIRPVEEVSRLMETVAKRRPGLQHSGEWHHRLKNGTVIDVDIKSHTLRIGEHNSALVVAQDITERKRVEAALRDSQAQLAGTIGSAMDAIISLDANQHIILFNPAAEQMFGCPAAEVIGQPLDRFIPERFRDEHRDRIRSFGKTNQTRRKMGTLNPLTCLRSDGEEFPAEITISQIKMTGQKIYTAILRDATERVRGEQALQMSERILKLFVEYAPAAIAMFDRDMNYLAASRRYISDYRLADENIVGRSHYEIFPEIPERWKEIHRRCLAGAIEMAEEDPFLRVDGTMDWVRWEIHPWYEISGEIGGIVLFSEVITERKRTKEAALESERQMRALVTSLDDIVFEFDEQGTYLNVWAADESLLARPKAQLLGRRIEEILGEENGRPFTEAVKRVLASGHPENIEYPLEILGVRHWFVARISPILVQDDSPQTVSMLVQDITERKQAEAALRESEQRFRRLFTTSPDAILLINPNDPDVSWPIIDCNEAACRMNGYTREELIGQSIDILNVTMGTREERIAYLNHLRREEMVHTETIHRHKDGHHIHIEVSTSLINFGGRELVMGIDRDVTERKRVEEALRESETRYRLATHATNDVIWEWNSKTHQLIWSENAQLVFGYSPEEIGPNEKWWDEHIHPEDRERIISKMDALIAGNESTWSDEYRFQRRDGSYAYINDRGYIEREAGGEEIRMVGAMSDITERKQAEQALRESETRFRSLVENSSDEVSIVNANGELLYESPTANPTLGYQPGEFLGQNLLQLIHSDDLERVQEHLTRLKQDPDLHPRDQFRLRHQDGTWRWVEAVGTNLLSEPSVRGIVINYHDITERVRAEREIKQRTEDLLIINTLNDALNRGEDTENIVEAFVRETRNAFDCHDVAIYLLTPDEKYIEMQNSTLPRRVTERIEKLIGRPIPKIQIPVREDSYFKRIMQNEQGTMTSDPKVIQGWIEEFTETTFLPTIVRPVIRKIVPQIYKALNIGSTISIPLISSGRTIGILDMSSEGQFTEEDLRRIRSISYQMTAVLMRKQTEKQVQLQLRRMSALSEIDRAITSSLDVRLSLDVLLSEVLSQLGVNAAAILLLNEFNLTLEFCAGKGFRSLAVRQSRMRLGDGFAGQVGLERKLLHVSNLAEPGAQFARADLLKDEGFTEYFGVPLIAKGMLKGVLEIFHRTPLNPDTEWINYLETLGGQAAIAIDNAQLFEGMQKSNLELIAAYDATIAGWSHAMDLRDKETEGHSQRVTELTLKLADLMGISEQEKVHIRRGALLHDMGKLGVPDHILLKTGKLSDEEWVSMRRHPTYAFEMLSPISYLRPALDIPYCHHEKWDGTGYPRGLKGEQIPLAARLFAVADVWDALTSDRPYRPAWSREKTLEYIQEQSGQHFDPKVVAVFLKSIASD